MSPSERLYALHSLNLRERTEETRRSVLVTEAAIFGFLFALVVLTYGVLS